MRAVYPAILYIVGAILSVLILTVMRADAQSECPTAAAQDFEILSTRSSYITTGGRSLMVIGEVRNNGEHAGWTSLRITAWGEDAGIAGTTSVATSEIAPGESTAFSTYVSVLVDPVRYEVTIQR